MTVDFAGITKAIVDLQLPLTGVVLFGSYARGEQKIHSDVDIAVVTAKPVTRSERSTVARAIAAFETADNLLEINCYYTTDEAIANATRWSDPCVAIREEGVVLWQRERI